MTLPQSTLAVLILWALCLPWCCVIALYWAASRAIHRLQFFAGLLFVRFMEWSDPNQGGA